MPNFICKQQTSKHQDKYSVQSTVQHNSGKFCAGGEDGKDTCNVNT